jgi:hypothetical protein
MLLYGDGSSGGFGHALVLDFVWKSGAQSRNRTSDTRIFNAF